MANRRSFIKGAAASVATVGFGLHAWTSEPIHSLGKPTSANYVVWAVGQQVFRKDLKTNRVESVLTKMLPHSFTPIPNQPHQILTVEKWKSRLAKVDFREGRNFKKIICSYDRRFYGHTFVLPDKLNFAVITVDNFSKVTFLSIYNIKELKLVDEYEIGFGGAHEIGILPDQRHLVIAMTGWTPVFDYSKPLDFERAGFSKLIFFDLHRSCIVDEQVLLDSRLSLAHLKVHPITGSVYAISDIMYPYLNKLGFGGVYKTAFNEKLRPLEIPLSESTNLRGEFLSVEVNSSKNLLAVTNPNGGRVLIFDTVSGAFVESFDSNTNGVAWTADGHTLLISERTGKDLDKSFNRIFTSQSNLFKIVQVSDPSATSSVHLTSFLPS